MRALLVTLDKYPDIDAGALRVHMFGKILLESGYEVHVVSMGPTTHYKQTVEPDGIWHLSLRGTSAKMYFKAMYYALFPVRLWRLLQKNKYDVIFHTQLDELSIKILQAYANKHHVPVVYDAVEWFSESQFVNGKKARGFRLNDNYNRKWIAAPSSVVAISSFLEKHFINRHIKTIRIPVILDTSVTRVVKQPTEGKVVLLYAGSPGKKDYLATLIEALDLLDKKEQEKIKLMILGCSTEQLISLCGVSETLLRRVQHMLDVRGHVPRKEVLEAYSYADFSVLIRPTNQRYAQAGFPTKFVESLCCSTPVICNLTSDLGLYAQDNENCVVLEGISAQEIAAALRRVIQMSKDEKNQMQLAARKTAEIYFDYKNFKQTFIQFSSPLEMTGTNL